MNRILKRIATYLENNTINTNISQNKSDESYEDTFNSQTVLINLNTSSKLKSLLEKKPVYKYEDIGFLKPAIYGDSFTNSKNEDIVMEFHAKKISDKSIIDNSIFFDEICNNNQYSPQQIIDMTEQFEENKENQYYVCILLIFCNKKLIEHNFYFFNQDMTLQQLQEEGKRIIQQIKQQYI